LLSLIWDWTPFYRVGVFKFGENIKEYKTKFDLIEDYESSVDTYDGIENQSFRMKAFSNLVEIDTANGVIESVSCTHEFIYKNKNVIGMNLLKLMNLMGHEISKIGEKYQIGDEMQFTVEYDKLGVMFWVNEENIIVKADAFADV
jgi:hypothetical protein